MRRFTLIAASLATLCFVDSSYAADFEIRVQDAAGTGFDDPTPKSPVGGNSGTTLGEQRRVAFEYAAGIWGELLQSSVTIVVDARFSSLTCSSSSAVLGSAGTSFVFQDFAGAPVAGTWYHSALADSLAGADLAPGLADISAQFNADLDTGDCLGTVGWYYGLDGDAGSDIDLVQVLLHELGHGLGFSNFVNEETGKLLLGKPDVYSGFTLDTSQGRSWIELSDAERIVSAKNSRRVVWSGERVTQAAPGVLSSGVPLLRATSDGAQAWYPIAVASFGAPISAKPTQGIVRAPAGSDLGCSSPLPVGQQGVILYLDLGSCGAETQAKAAEASGAAALVLGMTTSGAPVKALGGSAAVNIPVVSVSRSDGALLRQAAASGTLADIREDSSVLVGADPAGHVQLNAPDPVKLGSSISHWDPFTSPNLLMEPYATRGLDHAVDLSLPLLEDLGWASSVSAGGSGSGGSAGSSSAGGAGVGGAGVGGAGVGGAGVGGGGTGGSPEPSGGRGGRGGAGATGGASGASVGGNGGADTGGAASGGSAAGGSPGTGGVAGEFPGGNGSGSSSAQGGHGSLPALPDAGLGEAGAPAVDDAGAGAAAGAAGSYPDAGVRIIVLAPTLDCGCRAAGTGPSGAATGPFALVALMGLLGARRRSAARSAARCGWRRPAA